MASPLAAPVASSITNRHPARLVRRALVTAGLAGIGWLLGVWPPPVWWRSHWPRETAMMARADRAATYRPIPLTRVASNLQRMVVIGEDSRFWTHHGIDPAELRDALGLDRESGVAAWRHAWERRSRLRGASTITQQLAKNLYLSPSRSLWRKAKEAVTALRLELALPKARILELYLNVAEWGPGTWGVDGASRRYFGRPASALDDSAAAALAAALPAPRHANPAHPSASWALRRDLILERYAGVPVTLPMVADSETDTLPPAVAEPLADSLADTDTTRPTPPGPLLPTGADTTPDTTRNAPTDTLPSGAGPRQ
jgi:monofunctional biosynthetic peptidoglycan transglycosylase